MLPFYMTWETRQALIAESNRLLAARAARTEVLPRRESHRAHALDEDTSFSPDAVAEPGTSEAGTV